MKRLYNHYFPTPAYLAMNSFSVDISDKSIKYGELIATSSGLLLGKYGKEKMPEGVVVSGRVEKEDELVIILNKIKEKEGLRFIRVSLPEEQTYLFTLSLPKVNEENIKDMILLQIEEHIPLKAPDIIFDYEIISDDNQNILIEVVAVAGATMEGYLSVFEKAGLVPISFEPEAQAIARAVIPLEDNNPVMVVDFGETKTGVSISSNGRVFLTTTLSIGGSDLTNMIAKNFSIPFESAEKMKHEYGFDKLSGSQDVFPAILNGISVLRDELNKQYIYWETHNDNNKNHSQINHIILCGGDANLVGLSDYLELSMKIKIENANVWTNVLDTTKFVPDMSFKESLGYATVIGLALGGYMDKPQSTINILPSNEKKIVYREYLMRFFTILFNLIAIVGVFSVFLLFPSYFISKSEESMVEDRLEEFNKQNPELINNNIDKLINNINSELIILDKAKDSHKVSDSILNNILTSRTDGITFSQILFNKKAAGSSILEIHGIATSRDALRNFKTALDNNQSFSSVELPVSNFLEKADLNFTILITMK
jgi:type IV pilus assembly protein PilM